MEPSEISEKVRTIRKTLFLRRFKNEQQYLNNNPDDPYMDDRNNQIDRVLKKYSKQTKKKSSKPNPFEEIEKYMYKKSWNKLPDIHKVFKIDEYLTKHIINKKTKTKLLDKLKTKVYQKKLNTKSEIEYDSKNAVIIAIHSLKYDKETKKYIVT